MTTQKRNQLMGPTTVAFRFKIGVERQRELRNQGLFPEPDVVRPLEGTTGIPMWYPTTIEQFLKDHPEEINEDT